MVTVSVEVAELVFTEVVALDAHPSLPLLASAGSGRHCTITLWEHAGDRARRRAANARADTEKVKFQRRIGEIVGGSKPSKAKLRDAVRRIHSAEAGKPYEDVRPPAPEVPVERPIRQKRLLPVEEW